MASGKTVLVVCDNRRRLARAFMRMQEHYDSPEFRGRIFTKREFREWQKKTSGRFTYYDDWAGFNLPSDTLAPFYDGQFLHLTSGEKYLLRLLKRAGEHEYVIAAVKNEDFDSIVRHEFAHMAFFFSPDYRAEAVGALVRYKGYWALRNMVIDLHLHHPDVISDEIIAYAISGTACWLPPEIENAIWAESGRLDAIFRKHFGFALNGKAVSDLMKYMKVVEF
jgi:hypothetical protein